MELFGLESVFCVVFLSAPDDALLLHLLQLLVESAGAQIRDGRVKIIHVRVHQSFKEKLSPLGSLVHLRQMTFPLLLCADLHFIHRFLSGFTH